MISMWTLGWSWLLPELKQTLGEDNLEIQRYNISDHVKPLPAPSHVY